MNPLSRRLLPLFLFFLTLVGGCAGPKASFILLPEENRPTGEVTVQNQKGAERLTRPFESVAVEGGGREPGRPVQLDPAAVREQYRALLEALPQPPVHYQLYFEFGSARLLRESERLLPEIARVVNARRPAEISVVGHADTVGTIEFNYNLGLRRATTVAEKLTALGAAPVRVDAASRGKNDPQVKTPDETAEPRNRRAEVTVR
ncbi:hypothetical protein GMST_02230 [Geomonas silvestris]|uniref:OmpA-like domain-containing protein n=1 Tax=Geomonas silvestris TaxID=2740184 RepID=A0A6V8MD16_9BACT|nr:OmpA family protein [Geomonas silvestris]GFO57898.1 hypothetical protein GMST_02230 [Geomonas silvestris]